MYSTQNTISKLQEEDTSPFNSKNHPPIPIDVLVEFCGGNQNPDHFKFPEGTMVVQITANITLVDFNFTAIEMALRNEFDVYPDPDDISAGEPRMPSFDILVRWDYGTYVKDAKIRDTDEFQGILRMMDARGWVDRFIFRDLGVKQSGGGVVEKRDEQLA